MTNTEEWKEIPGFEGIYEVSNFGRIRTVSNGRGRIIHEKKPTPTKKGYMLVQLWSKNKRIAKFVHRLVAEAFIPNPNNLPQVNHKDEDKANNHVDNLEWCDDKYNVNYGTGLERARLNRLNKGKCRKIGQYTMDDVLIREYQSIAEAARNGFTLSSIVSCLKGKRKKHKNFKWKYLL